MKLRLSCTCFVPAPGTLSDSVGVERWISGQIIDFEGFLVVRLPPPPPLISFYYNDLPISRSAVSNMSPNPCTGLA